MKILIVERNNHEITRLWFIIEHDHKFWSPPWSQGQHEKNQVGTIFFYIWVSCFWIVENSCHGYVLLNIIFDLIGRIMLALAWLIAPICSLPQIFVFRLKTHPLMEEYRWTFFFFKFCCSFFLLLILMVICQKFLIGILQTVHYHRLLWRKIFQSG